jgi:DNA (cytosine-5)-methyltransferase 1
MSLAGVQHSLLEKKKQKKGKFTFIDLFAGIGGTRIAFERAGGECVFSSEWDKYCQKTYEANFGEIPAGDITKIQASEIPNFDILVGGFPCQAFSMAGKRGGFNDTRGTLFFDVARIIKAKRPKAFLLENVQGLVTHDGGKTLQVILDTLNDLDYNVFYKVLNASDFGVPQRRKRIYIVGFDKKKTPKDLKFEHPKGTRKNVYIGKFIEENVEGYGISEYLQKVYMFKKDDGLPEIVNKDSKKHVKTLTSTYHKIQRLTGTFVKDGKTGLRLLTVNECKAMMGFDNDFKIPVSRTQMYRQLGNSVAIPAVEAVAKQLVKTLEDLKIV